jgi:hypothetical protein
VSPRLLGNSTSGRAGAFEAGTTVELSRQSHREDRSCHSIPRWGGYRDWTGFASLPESIEDGGEVGECCVCGFALGGQPESKQSTWAKQKAKNEANCEARNMRFDEDLSQDGSEMSRKTNPTSRERGVIGSGCEASRSLSEARVRRDRPMGSVLPVVRCPAAGRAARPGAPPCERNAECQSCSLLFLSQPSADPGNLPGWRGRRGSSCTILEMWAYPFAGSVRTVFVNLVAYNLVASCDGRGDETPFRVGQWAVRTRRGRGMKRHRLDAHAGTSGLLDSAGSPACRDWPRWQMKALMERLRRAMMGHCPRRATEVDVIYASPRRLHQCTDARNAPQKLPLLPFFGTLGAASRRDGSLNKALQHYEF